ncbi:VOC family protein [Actinomadura violacea]|uniref:VOC family protein n=1 Tax=Actinomadura violacea TaxID=2819934 RepID=A0ABS3S7D9_9ACTN|nr:VOC family protein [Actinomadura violacea]MBO2464922.1 VOC family protein [Actinomadura violacea]
MTTIPTSAEAVQPATLGLNHVNLVVSDVPESVRFYTEALGMRIKQVTKEITFLATPGAQDVLALQAAGRDLDRASGKTRRPGDSGGVDHIGFDVADTTALQTVIGAAQEAGGELLMQFTGADGLPTAFIGDPDGYVLQLSPRHPTDNT